VNVIVVVVAVCLFVCFALEILHAYQATIFVFSLNSVKQCTSGSSWVKACKMSVCCCSCFSAKQLSYRVWFVSLIIYIVYFLLYLIVVCCTLRVCNIFVLMIVVCQSSLLAGTCNISGL